MGDSKDIDQEVTLSKFEFWPMRQLVFDFKKATKGIIFSLLRDWDN